MITIAILFTILEVGTQTAAGLIWEAGKGTAKAIPKGIKAYKKVAKKK